MPRDAKRVFVRRRGVHRMHALAYSTTARNRRIIVLYMYTNIIFYCPHVCVRVWGVEYFQIFNRLPREQNVHIFLFDQTRIFKYKSHGFLRIYIFYQ